MQLDTWAGPFNGGQAQRFTIAGKDGRFQLAKAEWLDKNAGKGSPNWGCTTVVLTSPWVPEPLYLRYAWARNPLENLKSLDNTGLPFDTHRNDTRTLADMYEIYTGKKSATLGVPQRNEQMELQKALQTAGLKRRASEARSFLEQHPNP